MRPGRSAGVPIIAAVTLRRAVLLLALALAVTSLGACGSSFSPPAAVIDGHTISQAKLQSEVELFLKQPSFQAQATNDVQRASLTREVLKYLLDVQVASNYADGHGIRVTHADVDRQLSQIETQLGGPAGFRRQVLSHGVTLADVRRNIEENLLLQQVQTAVAGGGASTSPAAFAGWLRRQYARADLSVNPRFGRFDRRTGTLVAITSTANLGS